MACVLHWTSVRLRRSVDATACDQSVRALAGGHICCHSMTARNPLNPRHQSPGSRPLQTLLSIRESLNEMTRHFMRGLYCWLTWRCSSSKYRSVPISKSMNWQGQSGSVTATLGAYPKLCPLAHIRKSHNYPWLDENNLRIDCKVLSAMYEARTLIGCSCI